MELIRRYIRPPKSSGDNSLFPLHLTLEEVSSSSGVYVQYHLEPTTETIALADYVLQNKQLDPDAFWGIEVYYSFIPPSSLYINGEEIDFFYLEYDGITYNCTWHNKSDNIYFRETHFCLDDTHLKKGTMEALKYL
jgi:hypothetical protein